MEASTEEQKRGEETYNFCSPCHLFNQLVSACFKCFGRLDDEDDHSTTLPAHTNSPLLSERAMKTTEDEFVVESRAVRVKKRPQRPPIGSGGGGQTN
ncbi:hypothetical protein Pint_26876 [Pistacia integerrima]|uniref:Uncharacterized protein n=1 Tax=Pistacia integerrima TaxID=434235 RepID=A0ACC0YS98_9ROSI|nr:hypothetical protein Pint_26876 [Pistacia integerrima]